MAPVVMGVGAVVFWIGAVALVNPGWVTQLRHRPSKATAPTDNHTRWRVIGGVLVVVGIGLMLGGAVIG